MVATFPIQYTETVPSGRAPSALLRLDVSTGAEYIAKGVGQIGSALYEVGQKIDNTNKVLDLSKGERQREMAINAALSALRAPGFDPNNDEAVRRIREKAETDMQAFRSKYDEVNNELTAQYNQNYAEFDTRWNGELLQLKAKRAADEQGTLETHFYEMGNLGKFAQLQYSLVATGQQGQIEADNKIADFQKTSVLHQARIAIGNNRLQDASILYLSDPEFRKGLSGKQLDDADKLARMAQQQSAINTDNVQNEITFGMFENRNKTLAEKATFGNQYINTLKTTSGLSAESARVMTNRIEKWMAGEARPHNSLVYTDLFRDVTQLHRGLGKAEEVKRAIRDNFDNLDDEHFESLNKYHSETVEEWNADTLRRLEKEAIPHLAPNMAMWERFMQMPPADQQRYKSLIDRLHEPAKRDADRLALYLNQCRKWIVANPTAVNFYERGKNIRSTFERYTDDQIRQMEKQLESEVFIERPETISRVKPEIPTVKSDAEYDALPKGTVFADPNGKQWRKP